ncbi:MAG: class I SAM-dependent methyltransferase [Candidatus Omnitrophica bacterium]|nr:class I SAM-dependent methyltransferase [Candidatus Omnitrophota bacterium]
MVKIIIVKCLRFYRKIIREIFLRNGIFVFKGELPGASLFPVKLLDKTIELFNPKTVLDLGCGTGKSLDYFISKNIEAIGIEGSKLAISRALHPEKIIKFNLERCLHLNRRFDLIWSFEFVEHLHPEFVDNLLNTFSNHSDRIVLSAAKPGQGGDGHFNEQPDSYWIEQFRRYGYEINVSKTMQLRRTGEQYAENMLVFER